MVEPVGRSEHPPASISSSAGSTSGSSTSSIQLGQDHSGPAFDDQGYYRHLMEVRDYELDQFGVVNNAVYASYTQHARHKAIQALGFNVDDFGRAGTPLALASLTLNFQGPLRSQDEFEVCAWVERVTGARIVVGQSIKLLRPGRSVENDTRKSGQPILTAEAVVVFLDSEYRPTRVPPGIKQRFEAMHVRYKQAKEQKAAASN